MVSFVLTKGGRRWYIVGAYVPTNDVPKIARVEQALGQAAKGVEVFLLGDLTVRLGKLLDARQGELVTVVAEFRLEDMTDHFMPM